MSSTKKQKAQKTNFFATWDARRAGYPLELKKWASSFLILLLLFMLFPFSSWAGPQSSTYELKEYGFGAGGIASASSTTYSLFGVAGEQDIASQSSTTYGLQAGLTFTMQGGTPPAPVVNNPGSTYDRLQIIINTGGNPSDTKYAIAISDDNWATTKFVKSDYTMGTTLTGNDWLLYSGGQGVGWGGGSGFYVTGLKNSTTYRIRVKAKQGVFTETRWSNDASAATVDPTLSFNLDSSSITFSRLNAGNSYTDSSKTTVMTTSTNAYNGYIVYGYETAALTNTNDATKTIANYASPNSAPTTWSGTGFGYTTNDNNLTGGTSDRFTNGGPKYAGFTTASPGDPVADHAGPVPSPISNEQFTVSYRVTAPANTTAGTYKTQVIYIITPQY